MFERTVFDNRQLRKGTQHDQERPHPWIAQGACQHESIEERGIIDGIPLPS